MQLNRKHLNAQVVTVVNMAQTMNKRIPVSEERWRELGKMKEAGQTYDDLMKELIQARNRQDLANRMRAAERGEGEWFSLDEV